MTPRFIRALAERYPALPRILPFALLIAGIALDGALHSNAARLPWDLRWDYAGRSALALLAVLLLRPQLPELQRSPSPASAGAWLLATAVGVGVLGLWIAPLLQAFSQSLGGFDLNRLLHALNGTTPVHTVASGSGFTPLDTHGAVIWPLALARLAGSALAVPIAEELFWRSFLMRWVDRLDFLQQDPTRCSLRALGLQALVFGAEHDLWLAGMIAGLAYGWLYRHTGRLWPGIVAHAITNGLLGLWVLSTQDWTYW
jgi:membrane protease YdiL (CAAX protease family)